MNSFSTFADSGEKKAELSVDSVTSEAQVVSPTPFNSLFSTGQSRLDYLSCETKWPITRSMSSDSTPGQIQNRENEVPDWEFFEASRVLDTDCIEIHDNISSIGLDKFLLSVGMGDGSGISDSRLTTEEYNISKDVKRINRFGYKPEVSSDLDCFDYSNITSSSAAPARTQSFSSDNFMTYSLGLSKDTSNNPLSHLAPHPVSKIPSLDSYAMAQSIQPHNIPIDTVDLDDGVKTPFESFDELRLPLNNHFSNEWNNEYQQHNNNYSFKPEFVPNLLQVQMNSPTTPTVHERSNLSNYASPTNYSSENLSTMDSGVIQYNPKWSCSIDKGPCYAISEPSNSTSSEMSFPVSLVDNTGTKATAQGGLISTAPGSATYIPMMSPVTTPITAATGVSPIGSIPLSPGSYSSIMRSKKYQRFLKLQSPSMFPFECHICHTSFRIKGYLTRHLRKHIRDKPFICPFYAKSKTKERTMNKTNLSLSHQSALCHPTGGFTRRDTYKTHLKALHFEYPIGVKSDCRNQSEGRCRGCGKWFVNNEFWIRTHMVTGQCVGLTTEETGLIENSSASDDNNI
ncbi:hypothetical protein NADFUDRAFT_83634 [Nadsonia fulvescens var. elongata DSM 6958]|uniref:C2H2-type domain-containing protein n=1 Tax=Nadsonia fulvescens var. elongata DSM 6958 TaxID=857566 RepID=A0A1E3PH36_9ASCO|nr:hypothetical protein NADFUDRAFT_83634 [Nadsonia fulvescens var. elongata DSM 6958]